MRGVKREIRRSRNAAALLAGKLRIAWLRLTVPGLRIDWSSRVGAGCRFIITEEATIDLRSTVLGDSVLMAASDDARILLDHVGVGPNSVLVAREGITMRRGSMMAEMAVIRDSEHVRELPDGTRGTLADGLFVTEPIEIGEDASIGTGAIVLRGVTIGPRATVGAGAVVKSDVTANDTVVGVPARSLKDGRLRFATDADE